jgi:SAM-dependent methyltransferase
LRETRRGADKSTGVQGIHEASPTFVDGLVEILVIDPSPANHPTWDQTRSDAHFADQAASWNGKYCRSINFQARLNFVGKAILSTLERIDGARVLDFGSGTGLFATVAAQAASLIVSVDRSLPMLRAGKADSDDIVESLSLSRLPKSVNQVLRVAGDDTSVAAFRCRFDLISAIAVLEYVDDCSRVITHLGSALVPGGRMLITVPNPRSPFRWAARPILPTLQRIRPTDDRLAGQSYLLARPNGDRPPWREAARRAGLSVEHIRRVPFGTSGPRFLMHPNLLIQLVKE